MYVELATINYRHFWLGHIWAFKLCGMWMVRQEVSLPTIWIKDMFGAFFTDWYEGDRLVGVLGRDVPVGHSNFGPVMNT